MKILALIFAAAVLSTPCFADNRQFADGEQVVLQPDLAYVLVRTFDEKGKGLKATAIFTPVLVRTLSKDELQQANDLAQKDPDRWMNKIEPNVVGPYADRPYMQKDVEEFMVFAVKPGVYALGGVAIGNTDWTKGGVVVASLCMGTVKFEAKPGMITDLGAVVIAHDDHPTDIPELAKIVSGKDRGFGSYLLVVAVRPVTSAMETPEGLKALPIVTADYSAVDAFPNFLGGRLSRLAPLPGVLDYDKDGHAIDLHAGSKAPQP